MKPDQVPEGAKFRATAAAALDGVAGAWGDGDMLCVALDASGNLVAAAATTAIGVIWTPEGRKDPADGTTTFKDVIGGKKYTVITGTAEFVEAEVGTSPALSAGDFVHAAAAGDVSTSGGAGAIHIGMVIADQASTPNGSRLVVDVGRGALGT